MRVVLQLRRSFSLSYLLLHFVLLQLRDKTVVWVNYSPFRFDEVVGILVGHVAMLDEIRYNETH